MSSQTRFRHAYERSWNAVDALTATDPLKNRVANAYKTLMPLKNSDLPDGCKEILEELNRYFSNDSRSEEMQKIEVVSIFDNNRGIMTGPLAKYFTRRIVSFGHRVFFATEELA